MSTEPSAGTRPVRVLGLFGPSGAGKTTLARLLPERWPGSYEQAPTVSTRAPRPDDMGIYRTVSVEEFERLSAADAFLAQTEIRASAERRLYAYRRDDAERCAANGRILVAPLERRLTECLRAALDPAYLLVIGLCPPGRDDDERVAALASRMMPRYANAPEALADRLRNARDEDLSLLRSSLIDLVITTDDAPDATASRIHEAALRWFA